MSSGKSSCSDRVSHPPRNQTSDYVHCLAASLPPHTSTERNCDLGTTHQACMANPDGDVAMKTALSNSAMSGRRTRPTHDAIPQGPGLVTTMNPRPCRPEPDSAKKQSSRCEAWVIARNRESLNDLICHLVIKSVKVSNSIEKTT